MEHIEIRMRDCSHNLNITAPPLKFNFLKNINKIQMPPITETFANMVNNGINNRSFRTPVYSGIWQVWFLSKISCLNYQWFVLIKKFQVSMQYSVWQGIEMVGMKLIFIDVVKTNSISYPVNDLDLPWVI